MHILRNVFLPLLRTTIVNCQLHMHITRKFLFVIAAHRSSEPTSYVICTEKVLLAVAVCSSNPFVIGREKRFCAIDAYSIAESSLALCSKNELAIATATSRASFVRIS